MRAFKRVGLEVLGWGLLLAGLAALVLPGPGLLGVFAGLAVLSQQYEWAERRLAPVKYRAMKSAAQGVQSWWTITVSLLGVLGLWAAAALWAADPPAPGWWPFPLSWWLPGGIATSVTLVLSGLIALVFIGYSWRRFRGHPEELEELEAEYRADVEGRSTRAQA